MKEFPVQVCARIAELVGAKGGGPGGGTQRGGDGGGAGGAAGSGAAPSAHRGGGGHPVPRRGRAGRPALLPQLLSRGGRSLANLPPLQRLPQFTSSRSPLHKTCRRQVANIQNLPAAGCAYICVFAAKSARPARTMLPVDAALSRRHPPAGRIGPCILYIN